ncbi:thioesterase-like superfamily-domain-containing protein [Chaetomium tenue]|uniref:Thioesterase-like superfamily-domain-containing protein n=1 Tax=Chaetomium tenue TaxID=1854479 RepID=A0ACB7NZM9_9PEZI|nr:thioesterase-like superfamily-domain-containing protein [Chaetomium globosum]
MDKAITDGLIPFAKATQVERVASHTYKANLSDTFCIGTVPNGGYVASCILEAAGLHLAERGQRDVLNAHFQFLNRTEIGPAIVIIEDVKLGRQLSTLHVTLYQHALLPTAPWITQGSTRKEIAGYLTMTNLKKESGISLPTGFTLQHSAPALPRPDFAALKENRDANWIRYEFPGGSPLSYARCLRNCIYYDPRGGRTTKSVLDKWVRLASGENFTAASLGYVADCWPYVVEAQRPTKKEAAELQSRGEILPFAPGATFWYPTVVLNLEIKKALPEEGLEWLQMRVQSKQIKDGRFDLEVLLLDENGDLVALSNHVNLILGSERNTADRTRSGDAAKKSLSRI